MKKNPFDSKNAVCQECKRSGSDYKDLIFVRWLTKKYTCEDCLTVAYHTLQMDKANHRRAIKE